MTASSGDRVRSPQLPGGDDLDDSNDAAGGGFEMEEIVDYDEDALDEYGQVIYNLFCSDVSCIFFPTNMACYAAIL
jgi:hypothetical protein